VLPVITEDTSAPPLGAIFLRIDPESYLYPFIRNWPIPSESAETLLVRRDNGYVLFLNELKFQKNTALSLRFPVETNKDLFAVKAILKQKGIVRGIDYRKVPVVAYVRPVDNTPWFIVARLDASEAYGPVRRQLLLIVLLAIASVITLGTVIWYVWYRHKMLFYKAQYLSTEKLRISEARFRTIFNESPLGVALIDSLTGQVYSVNPKFAKIAGRTEDEMVHIDWVSITHPDDVQEDLNNMALLNAGKIDGFRMEKRYIRPDGTVVWVNMTIAPVSVEDKTKPQHLCIIDDITERKRINKELAEARETQYRTLIENLPQKVFLKDRKSAYISCNSNYSKDLKIKPEEIVGKTDYDFFPTYLAEKYRHDDKRVMDSGEIENIEEEFVVIKDFLEGGEKSIINTVKIPTRDKGGNIVGLFGLFWDITANKKAQLEIVESEKKFRTIFDNASDGIVVVDPRNKKFYMANNTLCRMLGYSHDEIIKLGVADIHPEKALSHAVDQFEKQVRGESPLAIGLPVKRKDGTIFYADINAVTVGISGRIYLARFFSDITGRINADAERKTVLNWQRAIDSIQLRLLAPAALQDKLKIITDGVVRIFGADFCRIWLIKPGDLCEKGCIHAQVMEGPHVCRHRDKCLHLMVSSGRYTHIDSKGYARVPFGCYKIGLIASGEGHKFLTNDVVNDPGVHDREWARELGLVSFAGYQLRISNRETIGVMALFSKRPIVAAEDAMLGSLSTTISFVVRQALAEDEKIHLLGLKTSADIKSKFTSMVSHELRSPLAVIKESINLVLEELLGGVTPEQKSVLDTAKSNIDRLNRLINNVLDFQKIESGKMVINLREYDFNKTVLSASKDMNILAQEKGLGFTVNIDESMPIVRFDNDKIAQVLINLLSNAIKFTEKGSIEVSTEREDNMLHVIVRDTGLGIHAEEMPKLFQTFEQLDGGLGKKRGGTGLGLAISKEIILAHNGKIWAESQFGKGSAFHFTLPIKERRG